MSYLGQSQTPWEVEVSEVDLPAQHYRRWGPFSGLGQASFDPMTPILNIVDPLNLFHGQAAAGGAPPVVPQKTTEQKVVDALPYVALAGVAGLVVWKIVSKKRKV